MRDKRDSQNEWDHMTKDDSISMNEELQEWLKETRDKISMPQEITKTPKEGKMKPSGKCQICGAKDANFVCLKCKRSVCVSCYFNILGVCKKCVPKDIVEKLEEKHPDWENVLGVEWVD